jgi:SAM-dependent methyltransferase
VPPAAEPDSRRLRLEEAIAAVQGLAETDPLRQASRAQALLDDRELAAAALLQVGLRIRGRAKFGDLARQLLFTPDGLEQATRPEIADHRAARYARSGIGSVLDLCCGIGADALGFLRAGLAVHAVERDAPTAEIARANLAGGAATVELASAQDIDWHAAESVFIDPARRGGRGRTFDPKAYSPDLDFVTAVLAGSRFAAAKLGPGLDHALIPAGVEAEWVSFAGGVKELTLWSAGFGAASEHRPVTRRATVLPGGAGLTDSDPEELAVGEVAGYLYEADGAVIRAGLVRQAAAVLGGHRIDEHLAYLSADGPVETPFARGYRVLDTLPYSLKRLRAELRHRQVGIVEIKKRGVDVDPARLRRELKPQGPNSLTVLLARIGQQHIAILAEPLARSPR